MSNLKAWLHKNYLFLAYIVAGLGLWFTFFFDNALLRRGFGLRFSWLDGLMLYLTDFGLLFLAVCILVYLIYHKNFRVLSLLILSLIFSFEISYIIKLIFQVPRPYYNLDLATIPLTQAAGYSFPSLHSAISIGLLPFLPLIFKSRPLRYLATIMALAIAFSRPYLGVHYFSDILAGGIIGLTVSLIWLKVEEKYSFSQWFLFHVKDKLELRRQIAHFSIGAFLVFLIELKLLTPQILFAVLILGGALSLIYRWKKIPILHEILVKFERPADLINFPGKGPFFLILGSLLTLLIFPIEIAKASIIILAVGDSVNHIVGRYFGRTPMPFSKNKKLEGTVVAIAFSIFGALLFVSFPQAFLASLITLTAEAIYPEKIARYLDDNLMVPLLAGAIMILL